MKKNPLLPETETALMEEEEGCRLCMVGGYPPSLTQAEAGGRGAKRKEGDGGWHCMAIDSGGARVGA